VDSAQRPGASKHPRAAGLAFNRCEVRENQHGGPGATSFVAFARSADAIDSKASIASDAHACMRRRRSNVPRRHLSAPINPDVRIIQLGSYGQESAFLCVVTGEMMVYRDSCACGAVGRCRITAGATIQQKKVAGDGPPPSSHFHTVR